MHCCDRNENQTFKQVNLSIDTDNIVCFGAYYTYYIVPFVTLLTLFRIDNIGNYLKKKLSQIRSSKMFWKLNCLLQE